MMFAAGILIGLFLGFVVGRYYLDIFVKGE